MFRRILILVISLIFTYPYISFAKNHSVILLAGDRELPPFEYLDTNGNPKGLVIDIVREVSKELDIPIEIRLTSWDKALDFLKEKEVDGHLFMRITEDRQKFYDFIPILETFSVIVVPKDSQIEKFSQLESWKVACLKRGVSYEYLVRHTYAKVIPKSSQLEVLEAILNREADCGIVEYYFARWTIPRNRWEDKLKILPERLFANYNGIALPKESPYLSILNQGIKILKSKGVFDKIIQEWLGEEPKVKERLAREEKSSINLFIILIPLVLCIAILLLAWNTLRKKMEQRIIRERWLRKEKEERISELEIIRDLLHRTTAINDISYLKDIFIDTLKSILPNSNIKIYRKLNSSCYLWASYPEEKSYILDESEIKIKYPIRVGDNIFGYLSVIPDVPDSRIEAIRIVLNEFGGILKRIEDKEKLSRMENFSSLVEKFLQVEGLLENEVILQEVLDHIVSLLQAEAGSIMVLNESDNRLYIKALVGLPENVKDKVSLNFGEGLAGWVAVNKTPLVLEDVSKDHRYKAFPSIPEIKSSVIFPIIYKERTIGVLNINTLKDYRKFNNEDLEIITKVVPLLANVIEEEILQKKVRILNEEILISLVSAIEARDPYTKGHSEEVSKLAVSLGMALNLSEEEIKLLEVTGYLHDIGKLKIPDNILRKPGRLTDEEWEIMKQHPIYGAEMLSKISALQGIDKIVRHHHERWDGKGYPDGLSGEEIPLLSRIIGICDSFQAMISNRPYREALTVSQAIEELKFGKGIQFDPNLVDIFIEIVDN